MLLSPEHRYIVYYPQSDIFLVGVTQLQHFQNLDPSFIARQHNWKVCSSCTLRYPDAIIIQVPPRKNVTRPIKEWIQNYLSAYSISRNSPFLEKGFFLFLREPTSEPIGDVPFHEPRYQIWNKEHSSVALASCSLSGIGPFNFSGNLDAKTATVLLIHNNTELFLNYFPRWRPVIKDESKHYFGLISLIQSTFDCLMRQELMMKQG